MVGCEHLLNCLLVFLMGVCFKIVKEPLANGAIVHGKHLFDLFASQLALDEGGYIIADESTKTSIDGVYAAGDVRTKTLRQVVTAVSDGAIAADEAEKYIALTKD